MSSLGVHLFGGLGVYLLGVGLIGVHLQWIYFVYHETIVLGKLIFLGAPRNLRFSHRKFIR